MVIITLDTTTNPDDNICGDLTKGTTYNFRLAVRKYHNYTLRIYRGNSSSDGGPQGYIDINEYNKNMYK